MKRFTITTVMLVAILASSCGIETPRLVDNDPFIVGSIEAWGKSSVKYIDIRNNREFPILSNAAFIAPIGLFNIGDTIIITTKKTLK